MNILFLNSAQNWGGNERWIDLAAHILATDHSVHFAFRKDIVGERFKIHKIKLPFYNEFDLYTILKLLHFVITYQIDILVPTKPKEYFLAGVVSKLCDRKNVIRLGIVRELKNSWIKNLVYNKLADGIIVNAQSIKAALLKSSFMKAEKIRVIYNGVNSDEIDFNAKALIDRKINFKFLVASMGQLSKRKSMEIGIRGFADFITKSNASDAGLLIIGRGEKLIELQVLAQKLGIS
ncbi:glycosyltransferase, partial [candidate division KSB1 bacterium]|nr:glycosyltransferase [candidate division KSB1 bacterium]